MNLTKFGISAALLSVIGFFAGYTNLIAVVLLLVFVLYADADIVAKKNVTQATILSVFFGIIMTVFAAISSGYMEIIGWFVEFYKVYNVLSKLDFSNWIYTLIAIVEFGVMIYTVIASFKGNVVKLLIVTKMVNKNFGEE